MWGVGQVPLAVCSKGFKNEGELWESSASPSLSVEQSDSQMVKSPLKLNEVSSFIILYVYNCKAFCAHIWSTSANTSYKLSD